MSEINHISAYIAQELNRTFENSATLKNQIRSLELDIEFVGKAADKILGDKDCTADVFKSSDSKLGFDDVEIEKLNQRKEELLKELEKKHQKLQESEKQYQELVSLLEDCKKIGCKEMQRQEDDKDHFDFCSEQGEISYETLNLQEQDRRRIAMGIHDTVIQNLTALTLKNNFIIKIINSDRQRAQLELKSCNDILKESIQELRDIIFDLRPMSLDVLGFQDTFINLINRFASRTDMILTYDYQAELEQLNPDFLINLIRIIQELCTNAVKHSGGLKLHVRVLSDEDTVKISVEDNGVGFKDCAGKQKGFGLSMITDRVKEYNGQFEVRQLAKGVQCNVTIPIKEKNND